MFSEQSFWGKKKALVNKNKNKTKQELQINTFFSHLFS